MIEQLPAVGEPEWLSRIDPNNISEVPFPLADILRASLYYPSSGFDGDPVKYLAGNVVSFVYVDYGQTEGALTAELNGHGFRGYEVIARRSVTERELTPHGWPSREDGDPNQYRNRGCIETPFCSWSILQRLDEFDESHGPRRFSLLYLCADGVAAFQALYVGNEVAPAVVAIIQPGHGFGENWTNFEDPTKIFARSVFDNPAGQPTILLYGGLGERSFYEEPCWPYYAELVCFVDKAGGGSVGVWRHAQQQHAADGTTRRR